MERRSGAVAEWLGRGLQSLVHRFDSGRRLSPSFLHPSGWIDFAAFDNREVAGDVREVKVAVGVHREPKKDGGSGENA